MVDVSGGLIWDRERVNWMDGKYSSVREHGMLKLREHGC